MDDMSALFIDAMERRGRHDIAREFRAFLAEQEHERKLDVVNDLLIGAIDELTCAADKLSSLSSLHCEITVRDYAQYRRWQHIVTVLRLCAHGDTSVKTAASDIRYHTQADCAYVVHRLQELASA